MTGREKIERICGNFHRLTGEEGDYIRDLSRLLYEVEAAAPPAETWGAGPGQAGESPVRAPPPSGDFNTVA